MIFFKLVFTGRYVGSQRYKFPLHRIGVGSGAGIQIGIGFRDSTLRADDTPVLESDEEGQFMVESNNADVPLAQIVEQFGLGPRRDYINAHRGNYPALREGRAAEAHKPPFAGRQPSFASQVSVPLQKLPSSQAESLGVLSQEFRASLQESSVQPTASLQLIELPGRQKPSAQVSAPLQ